MVKQVMALQTTVAALGIRTITSTLSRLHLMLLQFLWSKKFKCYLCCDTTTGGGGWTVIQRRKNRRLDFKNRCRISYNMKFLWQETFTDFVVFHTTAKDSCLVISITVIILRSITGNHKCFMTK